MAAVVDVAAEKQAMRTRVRQSMAAIPPAQRALEEELVQAAIQAEPAWIHARKVLLYKAMAPELSVVGLTLAAWREGKATFFPRVAGPGTLDLHAVTSWAQLVPGAFGILEPDADAPRIPADEIDLAIVPGVAWDAAGHRLGRGGGYFDRLLPQVTGATWGVGFDCQVVPRLPRHDWDAQVDRLWHAASATNQPRT